MFSYFICIFFVTSFEGVRCWCVFSIQVNFISLTLTLDLWPLRTLRQLSVQVSVLLGDSSLGRSGVLGSRVSRVFVCSCVQVCEACYH